MRVCVDVTNEQTNNHHDQQDRLDTIPESVNENDSELQRISTQQTFGINPMFSFHQLTYAFKKTYTHNTHKQVNRVEFVMKKTEDPLTSKAKENSNSQSAVDTALAKPNVEEQKTPNKNAESNAAKKNKEHEEQSSHQADLTATPKSTLFFFFFFSQRKPRSRPPPPSVKGGHLVQGSPEHSQTKSASRRGRSQSEVFSKPLDQYNIDTKLSFASQQKIIALIDAAKQLSSDYHRRWWQKLQEEEKGFVTIKIGSLTNLPVTDVLSKSSDPFIKILVNGDTKERKTTVKKKTLNPEWNEYFRLPIQVCKKKIA
ncbi:C2 domain containing protein [Reticulomyxa filosa]|uniref:C2 domain containing protein n=1 Tax=Reticulomyxa filosa TaxID=46433 RepID=X6NG48_RETFI|nr:C2 domain containing protein [Reticulomyxa filosa]|eukprot:ETO24936.1 C2 domain containing protein [Reticulomyxa filosa]